jgi:Cu(I)/Ag(I) efflux system membrane fusion protein
MNPSSTSRTTLLLIGLACLAVGILGGYLLFGDTAKEEHDHSEMAQTDSESRTIWTCSMHPQIQREEPGDCPICGMDLIPQTAGSNDPMVLTMSEAAVAMARVRTSEVLSADGSSKTANEQPSITLSGRLAADERLAATQTAHIPGRIERLLVGFAGEEIRAGQKIAEIYSPELVAAQRELLEAERLQKDTNSALAATADRLREAAMQKLKNLRVDAATIQRVIETGEPVSTFPIYAESSGVVVAKKVEVGNYISKGEVLYTLTNFNNLWALFDVYEEQLAQVRVGNRISFSTPSAPGQTFSGKVNFINPLVDKNTRTASVRVEVKNHHGKLKPEMLVRGELKPSSNSTELSKDGEAIVPASAVLWTGERSVVYVEVPDVAVPSYEFREVDLGARVGDSYLINTGLSVGERVVTKGAFSIDAAAQLNNQFSMMNRDVTIQGREKESVTLAALPEYQASTPAAFKAQLNVLAKAYLPLKDAFVQSDLALAKSNATGFGESFKKVDMMLLKGDAHDYWMSQLEALNSHYETLLETNNIDAARTQFSFISQALINSIKVFGLSSKQDQPLYVEYCPMALKNEGANWISDDSNIRNPFFGDAMLTCGSVVDTFNF